MRGCNRVLVGSALGVPVVGEEGVGVQCVRCLGGTSALLFYLSVPFLVVHPWSLGERT